MGLFHESSPVSGHRAWPRARHGHLVDVDSVLRSTLALRTVLSLAVLGALSSCGESPRPYIWSDDPPPTGTKTDLEGTECDEFEAVNACDEMHAAQYCIPAAEGGGYAWGSCITNPECRIGDRKYCETCEAYAHCGLLIDGTPIFNCDLAEECGSD